MPVFYIDYYSDTTLRGYLRYAEHIKQSHRHHRKVKNSVLPVTLMDCHDSESQNKLRTKTFRSEEHTSELQSR